jgi:uncharacterized RDD family membrane protein YckC
VIVVLPALSEGAEITGSEQTDSADGAGPQAVATAYAGLVTRAIAIVLDALVIDLVALVVTGAVLLVLSVFSISHKHHALYGVIGGVLFAVWVISYFGTFWTTTGQTPGSRVMQIRVIRTDGTRLRPRHAAVRLAGMIVSLPLFWGYLPILTSARRMGVPDVLAGTVVVAMPGTPEMTARAPTREA